MGVFYCRGRYRDLAQSSKTHISINWSILAYLGRWVAMNFRIRTWTKMWKAKIRGTVFQVLSDYRGPCLA